VLSFTNAAAQSIQSRAARLVSIHCDEGSPGPTSGTFHAFAASILRSHGQRRSATIVESSMQSSLLCRVAWDVLRESLTPRETALLLRLISVWKSAGARPEDLDLGKCQTEQEARACRLYPHYQKALRKVGAMDLDDLILDARDLLLSRADVRETFRSRYRHILVDEFQDTSEAQYQLLKALALGPSSEGGTNCSDFAQASVVTPAYWLIVWQMWKGPMYTCFAPVMPTSPSTAFRVPEHIGRSTSS
jgi:superfamily I DNA/RNA helicase